MGAIERIEAFFGGDRLGRHAAGNKKRGIAQIMSAGVSKGLWISLAVIFIISMVGFAIQAWPNGTVAKKPSENPSSQPIKMNKSKLIDAYNRGDFKTIAPSLERFVSDHPDDQEMREMLASTYLLTGNEKRSLEEYRAILKANPSEPGTLYRIGIVLLHMDRTDEAISYLNRATKAAPNIIIFHSELARANFKGKYYSEAIDEWKIVLNLLPTGDKTGASVFAEIANNYILQNDFVQAKEAIASGLDIDPANEGLKVLESKIGGHIQANPASVPGVGIGGN